MSFGPLAATLARAAIAGKQQVPADAVPPPIPAECGFAYCAFSELKTTRAIGFGFGEIPWTAIKDYAEKYGLRGGIDAFDRFVFYIRAMDGAWLSHMNKR